MASYRWLQTLCQSEPLDVDEERFLNAWVETALATIERAGITQDRAAA
jgi:hypothetical protein